MMALELTKLLIKLFKLLEERLSVIDNPPKEFRYIGLGNSISYAQSKYVKKGKRLLSEIVLQSKKLELELKDLKHQHKIDLTQNIHQISHFFEIFLDHIINDWILQKSINSTNTAVEMSLSKLNALGLTLEHELQLINKETKQLFEDRLTILNSLI